MRAMSEGERPQRRPITPGQWVFLAVLVSLLGMCGYGLVAGGRSDMTTTTVSTSDREAWTALNLAWSGATAVQQAQICKDIRDYGPRRTAAIVAESLGVGVDEVTVEAWLSRAQTELC